MQFFLLSGCIVLLSSICFEVALCEWHMLESTFVAVLQFSLTLVQYACDWVFRDSLFIFGEYNATVGMWRFLKGPKIIDVIGGVNDSSTVFHESVQPMTTFGAAHWVEVENQYLKYNWGYNNAFGFWTLQAFEYSIPLNQWRLAEPYYESGVTPAFGKVSATYDCSKAPRFGKFFSCTTSDRDSALCYGGCYGVCTTGLNDWVWESDSDLGGGTHGCIRTLHGSEVTFDPACSAGSRGDFSASWTPAGRFLSTVWYSSWNSMFYMYGGARGDHFEKDVWALDVGGSYSVNDWAWLAGTACTDDGPRFVDAGDFFHESNTMEARVGAMAWAGRLQDDLMLIWGGKGFSGNFPNGLWLYSIRRNMFHFVDRPPFSTGNLNEPTTADLLGGRFQSAVLLPNWDAGTGQAMDTQGQVVVFGGVGLNENEAELFYRDLWVMDAEWNECSGHGTFTHMRTSYLQHAGAITEDCGGCDSARYTGTYCELWDCWGVSNTDLGTVCSGKGECVDADDCLCQENIGGSDCSVWSCFGIDRSDPNVCSGHGTCEHHDTCACDSGAYSGDECEEWSCYGLSRNSNKVCSKHGDCVDVDDCNCTGGYDDLLCWRSECFGLKSDDPLVCNSRGYCIDFSCVCNQSISGAECMDWECGGVSRLSDGVCNSHGVCSSPDTCDCTNSNYTGPTCGEWECFGTSRLVSSACSGIGACVDVDDCDCGSAEFSGENCELFDCFGVPNTDQGVCSDFGECVYLDTCECDDLITGSDCWNLTCQGVLFDDIGVCSGHGSCDGPDHCICDDPEHYTGVDCGLWPCFGISNDFTGSVCSGHGSCESLDTCVCDSNDYNGTECEFHECFSLPNTHPAVCHGNGDCVDKDNCECTVAFVSGPQCNDWSCFGVSRWDSDVCSGHGSCNAPDQCDCVSSSYTGAECAYFECFSLALDDTLVCSRHGECIDVDDCNCTEGYRDMQCDDYDCFGDGKDDIGGVCSGNGDCVAYDECDCDVGVTGAMCDVFICFDVIGTDSAVCSNGNGACTAPNECTCLEGLSGPQCSEWTCFNTSRLFPDVCGGHGVCSSLNNCTDCTDDFSGPECSEMPCFGIPSDDPNVCSGVGACIAADSCECGVRFNGTDCSECAFGHSGGDCEIFSCFSTPPGPSACSGNGDCLHHDGCVCHGHFDGPECGSCQPDYGGSDCEAFSCWSVDSGDSDVCGGHGTCQAPDVCHCEAGYGPDSGAASCSQFSCLGKAHDAADVCGGAGVGSCVSPETCTCLGDDAYGAECLETIHSAVLYVTYGFLTVEYVAPLHVVEEIGERFNCSEMFSDDGILGDAAECRWMFGFMETTQLRVDLADGSYDPDLIESEGLRLLPASGGSVPEVSLSVSVIFPSEQTGGGSALADVWYVFVVVAVLAALAIAAVVAVVVVCFASSRKQRQRFQRYAGVKNIDTILEEALAEQHGSSDMSHLKIKKELFEIDYDAIRLDEEIGSGGSGSKVYRALWKNRVVAFKVFPTHSLAKQEEFDVFERELAILSSIIHPNLLVFYGASMKNPRIGICSEWCEHGEISAYLEAHPDDFSKNERLDLIKQIALGMEYLHDRNITHRDLKPSNVLLNHEFCAKIIDFGASRVISNASNQLMTRRIGTGCWIAPEVVLSTSYDCRCDVFSFGILAWCIYLNTWSPYPDEEVKANIELRVANDPSLRPEIRNEDFSAPTSKEGQGEESAESSTVKEDDDMWLASLLQLCWSEDVDVRPSFTDLCTKFRAVLSDRSVIGRRESIRASGTSTRLSLQQSLTLSSVHKRKGAKSADDPSPSRSPGSGHGSEKGSSSGSIRGTFAVAQRIRSRRSSAEDGEGSAAGGSDAQDTGESKEGNEQEE